MDVRALLPAGAAIVFVLYLVWKVRPTREGRGPIDPRIRELRARAANVTGAERASALCEAGAMADEAHRPTAAFGYYLRAARANPAAEAPIRGLARALVRKPRSLEAALWRHLASLDVRANRDAARATLEELVAVHRRRRERVEARALEKLLAAFPADPGDASDRAEIRVPSGG